MLSTNTSHTRKPKDKGTRDEVGRGLKRRKREREEGGHIKVLGLARAVNWSIDSLHSYNCLQLKRVALKKVRPESR
jgi:hypothetical protein